MKCFFSKFFISAALSASSSAWATGGFSCQGETHSGKIVSVAACVPHSINGLCSGLTVSIDGRVFEIPQNRVPSFYHSGLKRTNLLALQAYDADMNQITVDLAVQYRTLSDDSQTSGVEYARLMVRDNGKTYSFKDVRCSIE